MPEPFVGIQIGAETILEEGIDRCFDTLQETAGVNALFIYPHISFGTGYRPPRTMATDHGVPPMDYYSRKLPELYVKVHEEFYGGTFLRFKPNDPDAEWADIDIFEKLAEPAAKRGIKLMGRMLGFRPNMANGSKVLNIDAWGRPVNMPCYNNPDYAAFCISAVEDLFKTHPMIEGFKWGAERTSPLGQMIYRWGAHRETVPFCFCEHCQAKGRALGINVERARTGMKEMYALISGLRAGQKYVDGAFVSFLRLLLKYSEILAWDKLWYDSKENVTRQLYGAIKAIKPSAIFGLHVHHPVATWDIFNRAHADYAEMAEYADFLKPVVYHDCAGPRLREMGIRASQNSIFRDLTEEQVLEFSYRVFGYDPAQEPKLDELKNSSLQAEYVYNEVKRCVDAVQGKTQIYAGVGFDVPIMGADGKPDHRREDPELVYQATKKSFEAGATGLVVSREYNEMVLDNLRAVGRAVREYAKS